MSAPSGDRPQRPPGLLDFQMPALTANLGIGRLSAPTLGLGHREPVTRGGPTSGESNHASAPFLFYPSTIQQPVDTDVFSSSSATASSGATQPKTPLFQAPQLPDNVFDFSNPVPGTVRGGDMDRYGWSCKKRETTSVLSFTTVDSYGETIPRFSSCIVMELRGRCPVNE